MGTKNRETPMTEEANKALEDAVAKRVQAGNKAALQALRDLVHWVPEGSFPLEVGVYDEDPDDPEAPLHEMPFCSEAYTYALLGKGDARSFLCRVDNIARALGVKTGYRGLRR